MGEGRKLAYCSVIAGVLALDAIVVVSLLVCACARVSIRALTSHGV